MALWRVIVWLVLGAMSSHPTRDPAPQPPTGMQPSAQEASGQQAGSVRGSVTDKEFGIPIAGATVAIVETGQKTTTTDQGNFVLEGVPPGKYTLVVSRDGYIRQVRSDLLVNAGKLTDVDVALPGEFTEMEEFVVQDVLTSGDGSEASLLKLRFESPALMDSIGTDLMSKAGASDAAGALRLVPGASVQGGKYAVIRGLPDRYVNSQMNGIRLPTADENKRAVELDQFPAPVIESVQVSKTFTPDQQGDASGGAVNLKLKGVPDEPVFQVKEQVGANTQATGNKHFLTYKGGGVGAFGFDDGGRDPQNGNLGSNWDGAVGVSQSTAPVDVKTSITAANKFQYDSGTKVGGLLSVFYERKHTYTEGRNDSLWVLHPGDPMTPLTSQGSPQDGSFKTSLYDVKQGTESLRWGGLGVVGFETERSSVNLCYLYTHTADDKATLAEDTRGKAYYFPGYDPNDPLGNGNHPDQLLAAPYLRLQTLEYTERTTQTLQLNGHHRLDTEDLELGDTFKFHAPEIEWTAAHSEASMDQPDKRLFAAYWVPASYYGGSDPYTSVPTWFSYKPAESSTLGNLQRIWKSIDESSNELALDVKAPFSQWDGYEGYFKVGAFDDRLTREFKQSTFSNFSDPNTSWEGGWDEDWSSVFPFQDHAITASNADDDYTGKQKISAVYGMTDLPLSSKLSAIGGVRFETTNLSIVNHPESEATWYPPGATAPVELHPGDADVDFSQSDVLPSIGLVYTPVAELTLRTAYSQTVARQTFKELTPIQQQEYAGGPIFIGNPDLKMSSIDNYDVRGDFTPTPGSLLSASWFHKDIKDPIEYVQRVGQGFTFTTPENYPKGKLTGYEFEVRQSLDRLWPSMRGMGVGLNATFIQSEVTLPADEAAGFSDPNIKAPMSSRDMTGAPDHIYNAYLTYDIPDVGTSFAIFYTLQGDTLIAGAGESLGNFVPSVYAKEYDSLNVSVAQRFGKFFTIQLQAKNLTNPRIEEVYRSKYLPTGDVTKSSFTRGIEYTLGATFAFSL